jgi:3-methyladenine DNA glycosylase/8-oxoguanine DNA glycosylase
MSKRKSAALKPKRKPAAVASTSSTSAVTSTASAAAVARSKAKPVLFGPKFDVAKAKRELSRRDPALGKLMRTVGNFELKPSKEGSVFHWLVRSILYQQLSGKAAATIHGRVKDLFGGRNPEPNELVKMSPDQLRAAGVSRAKVLALHDLARAALDGRVPDRKKAARMSDDEIVECLVPIRGIGRWTVEMLLIFALGRTDVLAVDDFALRKSVAKLRGLEEMPNRKAFLEMGEAWKPYRTVVSWYLWRALDIKN